MALVCGPKNSRFTYTGSLCPHTDLAIEVSANRLSEAISAYERTFNAEVIPAPMGIPELVGHEGKYFLHTDLDSGRKNLVDIHVFRGGRDLCVKQNLEFPILPGDLIEMGELIGQ